MDVVQATPARATDAVWVARRREGASMAQTAWPQRRLHRATRCGHCAYCHPQGPGGGLRQCAHPDRSGLIVFGDQFVCTDYRPAGSGRRAA
jgi:hypothetical protein